MLCRSECKKNEKHIEHRSERKALLKQLLSLWFSVILLRCFLLIWHDLSEWEVHLCWLTETFLLTVLFKESFSINKVILQNVVCDINLKPSSFLVWVTTASVECWLIQYTLSSSVTLLVLVRSVSCVCKTGTVTVHDTKCMLIWLQSLLIASLSTLTKEWYINEIKTNSDMNASACSLMNLSASSL
jgi:hypothetical protein